MSFASRYTTGTSAATRGVVTIAMVARARETLAGGTALDAYKPLALAVLNNPAAYVDRVSLAAVTDPAIVTKLDAGQNPTDAEIYAAVTGILMLLTWQPVETPVVE